MAKSIYIILIFIFSISYAQDNSPFEIEEENEVTKKENKSFAEKYKIEYSGNIGTTYLTSGSTASRRTTSTNLAISKKWNPMKIYLSGEAYSTSISYTGKRREYLPMNIPEKRTIKYSNDGVTLRDAYLELYFGEKLTMTAGRQVIVWGQFDLFSPVDSALPYKTSSTGIGFSKANSRLPMDSVKLSYYPIPKIELQTYYIPKIAKDELLDEYQQSSNYLRPVGGDINNLVVINTPLIEPRGSEEKQTAIRLMFYPDWATIGLTYYNGWDTFPNSRKEIAEDNGIYYHPRSPKIEKKKMYGFEISRPWGKSIIKFEIARWKTNKSLRNFNQTVFQRTGTADFDSAKQNFYTWIVNNNDSKLYVPFYYNIMAIGLDRDTSKWLMNIALFFLYEEPANDRAKRAIEGEKKANLSKDDNELSAAPALNIVRKFGKDNYGRVGFALGMLGEKAGASLYLSNKYKEALDWVISINYLMFFNDDNLSDAQYEIEDTAIAGLGVGLVYNF